MMLFRRVPAWAAATDQHPEQPPEGQLGAPAISHSDSYYGHHRVNRALLPDEAPVQPLNLPARALLPCYAQPVFAQFESTRRDLAALALCVSVGASVACCPPTAHAPTKTQSETASLGVARIIPSNIAFESLEGPFWVARWGALIFSDVVEQNAAAAKIYRFDPRTREFSVVPYPGMPITTNGLAVDAKDQLVACERWNGVLARVSDAQRVIVVQQGADGLTLNAPNDLTIRTDGNIYFTDTTWGAQPGAHAPTAVYRVAPNGARSVAFQINMPNGIALSPDGNTLYVGSDAQDRLWRLPVAADGKVGSAEPFGNADANPQSRLHVPDGMCVDDLGRVYVTNNSAEVSAIIVFREDGHYYGRIPLPAPPSNCTFGAADRRTLYVTTLHALYEVQLDTPGLP